MSVSISLSGKIALVTGGGRGIGRAITEKFAAAGASVAIASRKEEVLRATAEELASLPGKVHPIPCHVGRREDLARAVSEAESVLGPIDILVNNSATNVQNGSALEVTDEQIDKMVEVNIKSAIRLVSLVAPGMIARKRGGAIINLASISGLMPQEGSVLYSMSKAAIVMLTRAWARELGPHRIRVNAIAPGLIQTDFSSYLWQDEGRRQAFAGRQVLPHLGQPGEIGEVALFLAADMGSFITGQVIVADGGVMA